MTDEHTLTEQFRGLLLGGAVGDALGLPAEGLTRQRLARWYPGPWRHRLLWGRGMVSDDTEHSLFVAQSLLAAPQDAQQFARRLAGYLRFWLLALPAGVGLATGRAIVKLWLGFPPTRSGVFSAGNGPAMRAAPIGAFFARQPTQLDAYIAASTRLTHTDPRALTGARAVALLAAWRVRTADPQRPAASVFFELLHAAAGDTPDAEWQGCLNTLAEALDSDLSVAACAQRLGLAHGVGGYVYHSVPVAVYAWYRHYGDFRATLENLLDCGGDTDTTGAIAGALAGLVCGLDGIPADWRAGLWDWPRSPALLKAVAGRLATCAATGRPEAPPRYFWPAVLPRNILFLIIVLSHGLRRLLPPY